MKKHKYYTCPYSGVEYLDTCPVTTCPANISKVPDRPSGCFFNFLQKTDFTKFELAYAFDVPVRQIEKEDEKGRKSIQNITMFNTLLKKVKLFKKHKFHCPKCGVLRTNYGPCLNEIKCKERAHLAKKVLSAYPFNIEEFGVTKDDIFVIMHNRKKLNKYLKTKEEGMSVHQITQIPKDVYLTLIELNTCV